MNIIAYTLTGCVHCSHLKELFKRADVEYVEMLLRKDITVDEFSTQYPNINSFPFVVIDDKVIGGLVDVVKLFVKEGLVSSSKRK